MSNNLLAGLGSLGLENLENLDVFEKEATQDEKASKQPEIKEEDLLFDKSYQCPVCDNEFKVKMVRTGKIRPSSTDLDLRPRHEVCDVLKYDVVLCNHCGYAALTKNFGFLAPTQKKLIRENISKNYHPKAGLEELKTYSYEEALERHKLVLANTIVKHGKASEKANVCLKTAWIVRGMAEEYDPNAPDYQEKLEEAKKTEQQFLATAYDGFIKARESEHFPIAGMNQNTLDYLISALALNLEHFDVATKLIGGILTSKDANRRMKDKALEMKDIIRERKRIASLEKEENTEE